MDKEEANRKLRLAWKIAKEDGIYMPNKKKFVEIRKLRRECEAAGMWWHASRVDGVIRYLNKIQKHKF